MCDIKRERGSINITGVFVAAHNHQNLNMQIPERTEFGAELIPHTLNER